MNTKIRLMSMARSLAWTKVTVLALLLTISVARAQEPATQPGAEKKPPQPVSPGPQVVHFETADRVKIEADFFAPSVKEGQKAPLAILIHMYPADRSSWKPLIPELQKAGFGILAYDIRGHGGSTGPKEKKLKELYDRRDSRLFRDAWKDAEAARKWLEKQPGCDAGRIVLIGASIGCSISLDYACREQAVKGVVCLSPGTNYMGVDSITHIEKCADRPILLMAPEGEYAAVQELIKASGDKAKGEKYPGGKEHHGTNMFNTDYGEKVLKRIATFVQDAAAAGAVKP